jgi:Ca2+-binding RTX toxin-like protein
MTVYDRPGRTAGEFLVQGTELIWKNYQGDEVRIALNPDGGSPIEFFNWVRLAVDGTPYSVTNKIILPGTPITETNVSAAGTAGDDVLSAARFATYHSGFTELYGDDGNDTLTGSDTTFTLVYGGNGRDVINGIGAAGDDFSGDAGRDILRGLGGNDALDGGADADRLFGGNGVDSLTGGSGNDTVSGGAGVDSFYFNPKEIGIDLITDYEAGELLQFTGIAAAKVHAVQMGADVQVAIGIWGQVLVQHTLVADLVLQFA